MKKKIILLSGPIRSGKTTALIDHFQRPSLYAGGFVTPDTDAARIIINIHTGQHSVFQITEATDEEVVVVGKYRFLKNSFETASAFTLQQASEGIPFIVVDEIGKLELNNQGFDSLIIQLLKIQKPGQTLLFVVRDYLLEDVIIKYGLQEAEIIVKDALNEITGE